MLTTAWMYPMIFAVGFLAGLVDSIAGGGGMITLPALLLFGVPPQAALGTNKLQSTFGSFTAAWFHVQKKVVDLKEAIPGILFTFLGAAIGTLLVEQIDNKVLYAVIPFLLFAIAIYFLFSPDVGETSSRRRLSNIIFYLIFGSLFGFYDGFFGPGVGSFWAMAFVYLRGMDLTKATGATKLMNFTSNIVSCIIFLAGGYVWFGAGLAMAAGEIIGARIGSHMVIRKGTALIRPIYVTIVVVTTLKLLYNAYSR